MAKKIKKVKKRKMPLEAEVAATVVIRIPRYLRDEILSYARGSDYNTRGGYRPSRAPARVLLERLDPEVAKHFPNIPRQRR